MKMIYQYQEALCKKELLQQQIESLPSQYGLLTIRRNFEQGKNTLLKMKEKIISLQKNGREKEREMAEIDAHIETLETQIYDGSVTNPRELSLLQNKVKELNHKGESYLKQKETIEKALKAERERAQILADKLKKLQNHFEVTQSKLKEEHQALQGQMEEEEEVLTALKAKIKAAEIDFFMQERGQYNGRLYAVIINGHTCSCCHRIITKRTLDQVANGKETVCDNCNRLLLKS